MEIIRHIEISFNDSSGVGSSLGLYNSEKSSNYGNDVSSELVYSRDKFKAWMYEKRLKRHGKKTIAFIQACKVLGLSYIGVTLTIKDWDEWRRCRLEKGLSEYLNRVVSYCKKVGKNLVAYLWVMEYQSRGVPHYHVLFAFKDKKPSIPFPDIQHGWSYGLSQVKRLQAGQLNKNYLANYLKKHTQKSYDIYLKYEWDLKGAHMLGSYVKKEYRHAFFDAIVSSYSGWHATLCRLSGQLLRRKYEKGLGSYVELLGLKIRRLFKWEFIEGLVFAKDEGYWVNGRVYDGKAFWDGIDFVLT